MRLRDGGDGAELADVGIDANCAPDADVVRPETHPFLLQPLLRADPGTVARIARAVADGLMAGGVLPVMKHMPGHGLSHVDTHLDLPTVDASLDELRAVDFAPFRALADLPMAMTAHLVFSAVDRGLPATQSPKMIRPDPRRDRVQGLLMSDDLNMQALKGSLADRTARQSGGRVWTSRCTARATWPRWSRLRALRTRWAAALARAEAASRRGRWSGWTWRRRWQALAHG
jgi:beta-N-acetylhexosaminidase